MTRTKGLDDLLQANGRPRLRAFHRAPPELGQRRIPRSTPSPGALTKGGSLAEVRWTVERALTDFIGSAVSEPGQAQLVATPPGSGKTTALVAAAHDGGATMRMLVGTKALAREVATTHGLKLIEGRNAQNCERFEVVTALGQRGHDIERLACGRAEAPRCPVRMTCPYFSQFTGSGHRVGTAEQLFNRHFVAGGDVVALDDADLARLLIQRYDLTVDALVKALTALMPGPVEQLLTLLARAVQGVTGASFGCRAWDHLARTAAEHGVDLVSLIEALPEVAFSDPAAGDGSPVLRVADVENAPPASLQLVLATLRAELPRFLGREEFNGRLHFGNNTLEVRVLRESPWTSDRTELRERLSVIVLDATPVSALVDHLLACLSRREDVRRNIRLPDSVTVIQHASAGNGHAALRSPLPLARVLAEVDAARDRFPVSAPEKEAVIAYKETQAAVEDLGFLPTHVLGFGSVRGSNVLAQVERLHLIGRPMPPLDDVLYQANVIHWGEGPVSAELVMRPRAFGGQRTEIEVVDFADMRASALLAAQRDDEITQALHRARLNLADETRPVVLVLHTAHPIPGLRVDELVLRELADPNSARASEAGARIGAAADRLREAGQPLTVAAIAKDARAHPKTVRKFYAPKPVGNEMHTHIEVAREEAALISERAGVGNTLHTHTEREVPAAECEAASHSPDASVGNEVHTHRKISSMGMQSVPQSPGRRSGPPAVSSSWLVPGELRPDMPHWTECGGSCGRYVPPGQACFECAERSTRLWAAERRMKGRRPA